MKEFDELIAIVTRLRDKDNGCPWDLKQTSKSLIPNFIEELYETIEAIEKDNDHALAEELGDLLLHIVLQVSIASEKDVFKMQDVIQKINTKLIRRHPHIFADLEVKDSQEVKVNWERIKQIEKKHERESILDGVPRNMPALIFAQRTQEKAASVGFDWPNIIPVLNKLDEETKELIAAEKSQNRDEMEEELGDLLFTVVNLSRKLEIDAESALKKATDKFKYRFFQIERHHHDNNENIYESSLEKLDEIWESIKATRTKS